LLETYDLRNFGKKLKRLRVALGYSQLIVSRETGVNIDTLRKIENGHSIPRYDTLVHLSSLFKVDLGRILASYQRSGLLFDFLKSLDHLMAFGRFTEIEGLHESFRVSLSEADALKLVDCRTLKQINHLILAISLRYKGDLQSAYTNIICALRLSIHDFQIENFDRYRYSALEIRGLVVVAACLGDLRNCELSIRISKHVLTVVESNLYSDKIEDLYAIKSYANISYNYHRLDMHHDALQYAQLGIELSLRKGHLDMLHFLFLREAAAQYHLGNELHLESFKKCLYTLKISGDHTHYQHMVQIIKDKYNLVITL